MAAVETFGILVDPKKADVSKYPKLDNFLYKTLLTGENNKVPLRDALTKDGDLNELVQKFADDQKAFHEAFGKAFIKLIHLGHDAD